MKYRPDIDGLRCVAILSVLAFHLTPAHVPGGFVGVDVFFVISGYLISTILFSEISQASFSVLGFYERRVRRIFPALFCMLIVVSAAASFLLLPGEFVDYAKSAMAATLSSSNFYFWRHSNYFDSAASYPLLNTWSLAVEEQFYILFPIFLVIVRRFFPRRLKLGVVALFLASLAASAVIVHRNEAAAYYMPYTRAWELLLGTIISLWRLPRFKSAWLRQAAALAGIGMIGYAAFLYTAATPFPGLAALVPCAGAALIIVAGESGASLVGQLLSARPIVFIGLISYSLYLWHWPLIVLNNLGLSVNFSGYVPPMLAAYLSSQTTNKAAEILLSFALAILSWRYVERPFRAYPRRLGRRPLFALAAASAAVLLLCSGAIVYARGFQGRFPERAVQVASVLFVHDSEMLRGSEIDGHLGKCDITASNHSSVFSRGNCLEEIPGKDTYLLLGDSHAGALWDGLQAAMPNANLLLAEVWDCRPSLRPERNSLCGQMMDFVFQKYLPAHPVKALLLEARWTSASLNGVGEIVRWARARGLTVIVFGPVLEYDAPLPRLLAYAITWNRPNLVRQHRAAYSRAMDSWMQELAQRSWHVCYESLYNATCQGGQCVEYADRQRGIPLMDDGEHLNQDGSRLLVHRMMESGQWSCMDSGLRANRGY